MKNYTSLQKMKASEVAASFTEEKVTQETFKEEVAKGALYKAFEVPKNAKMLKFRYYSPDGTLIEQNNVPFVYDGTGIDSVENYYLLTDLKSGITLESEGWSKEAQTVTAEKRFLWTYTKTTYTNKAYTCTQPCISAVFGEQGERGAMYLGHYADNQSAYEANTPAVFTGDYYLNTTDSYLYEFNKEENVWRKISDINDYRYNQSINDIFAAIEDSTDVEKFIKAKKIWVQHLSAAVARVNQLYSSIITLASGTDLDGKATGGIIKSSNYNGTIQNGKITKEGTAGWAVDHSGKAEFQDGTFRGTFNNLYIKNDNNKNVRMDFVNKDLIGSDNISIGNQNLLSLKKVTEGNSLYIPQNNVCLGSNNLQLVTCGEDNIAIGRDCGNQITIEGCNTFIGNKCGSSSIMGNDNVAIGFESFSANNDVKASGAQNTDVGTYAGKGCRGHINICVGFKSGLNALAQNGIFIGESATASGQESRNCIAIGDAATIKNDSTSIKSCQIAIGSKATCQNDYAIAIGTSSAANGWSSIAIGRNAKTTLNNEINIGNQFRIIYFAAGTANSVIYNYFISHFPNRKWQSEMNSVESCVIGYYGSFCIGFIKNDYDNNLDFYNPQGNALRLTVKKDSTDTISYPLKIGFLHID